MKSIRKTFFWFFCAAFAIILAFGVWYFLLPLAFDKVLEEENTLEIRQADNPTNNQKMQKAQQSDASKEAENENNTASVDTNNQENTEKELPAQKIYQGSIETIDIASSGNFTVYEQGEKKLLWIENLVTDNGPDLFLVFSNQNPAWGNRDYDIIAPLPANRGSFMVEIPHHLDPADFQHLLIHCRLFAHTFAGGMLNSSKE